MGMTDYAWKHQNKLEKKRVKRLTSLKQMRLHLVNRALQGGEFKIDNYEETGFLTCDGETIYSWDSIEPGVPMGSLTLQEAIKVVNNTWVNGIRHDR